MLVSRRKKTEDTPSPGAPAWMTTYGDLVTNLLTFFVLLFSFSTIDAQKWRELVVSFGGNIGIFDGGTDIIPGSDSADILPEDFRKDKDAPGDQSNSIPVDDEFYQLYTTLGQYIKDNSIPAEVEISETQTEILIRFKDYILFDIGKADLKQEAIVILDNVAGVLEKFISEVEMVRVDGHTDSVPINTNIYPTNWELSGGRAARVIRYFQEVHGFEGDKLSFAGFGQYYSIDDNQTDEGRSRNRRVDILLVKKVSQIQYIED